MSKPKPRPVAPRPAASRPGLDFMAVGAHADDVELGCGGTLLRLASQGRKGVIIDLTDAAMGTRGTPQLRLKEAAAAAKVLGASRENLGLPDGRLDRPSVAEEAVMRLVEAIRRHRPKVLLTHHAAEYHPDHVASADIVKRAAYKAGLAKLVVPGDPYRPGRVFHFLGDALVQPTFCVDISAFWEKKVKSVLCYKSQFFHPGAIRYDGKRGNGKTDLATPAFLENVEARARFWGIRIKRRHAEAYTCAELPEVDDITALGGERFS